MLKSFVFGALLLSMIAGYLSYKEIEKSTSKTAVVFTGIGAATFFIMIILTINLSFSANPVLLTDLMSGKAHFFRGGMKANRSQEASNEMSLFNVPILR